MRNLFTFLLFFSGIVTTPAQQVITAKILDSTSNKPVAGAVISVQSDTARFSSNKLGYFQLSAQFGDTLIISQDHYETSKIIIPNRANFAIQLQPLTDSEITRVSNEYEKGQIVNGYKTGVWEYCDIPDSVVLKIDYDRNQIIYLAPDTTKYAIDVDGTFEKRKVDRQPRYIGSESELRWAISMHIQYPAKARHSEIQGTLQVAFTIGPDGTMKDFEVLNDIGYGCGEAAIDGIKQVPESWIPAILDGKRYASRFVMPFQFEIKKSPNSASTIEKVGKSITATYFDTFVVTAIVK